MVGGQLLAALFRGDNSIEADAGAILIAEAIEIFRRVHGAK